MRKKIIPVILSLSFTFAVQAQRTNLPGYDYAAIEAPQGNEWESPEKIALNKEQPRTTFAHFGDIESARKVLPENSEYWLSLNGTWKFNWVPTPEERTVDFYQEGFDASAWDEISVPSSWNIYGLQKDGTQKYGTPIYVNQPVIFYHEVKVDDWRKGVMRTPPAHWTTYKHRNEVGSYLREFAVPADWDGRNVYISFDGVDSFFYLWINGHYVGFSKNSRNNASFNITPYLNKKGNNRVAVEVYRNSDGSFLEAQDMFRLPGIFRTVAIYSTPQISIRDLSILPKLTNNYNDGELVVVTEITNPKQKKLKGWHVDYSLYANKLYSDENFPVPNTALSVSNASFSGEGPLISTVGTIKIASPDKWSAEAPYRYTLVAELKDDKGKTIETVSAYTGFRQVEIRETSADEDEFGLAGRYFYVNNKPVKLKGVNRHETNPALGHAITRELMEKEVMLMKRANINHVRTSHYPDDPYFYYLCDKYGIYLEDEANIESHEYYYGEASLSHPVEWRDAHVSRVLEMVHSDFNHPSIVIWSLGNEAGPGKNFVEAYKKLKEVDRSRPVQYERNNDIVDMGSNQYPSISWMNGAVKGTYSIKYPFHVSEYAHSMGNAVGNLVDYWRAIESTNFFCGGAIWDWVDQSMYNYLPDGTRYLAYGGGFGDTPNDGQFVMNGIVFADLEPKPQYYEVKKVYQYMSINPIDTIRGVFELFNKNYFTDLSDYDLEWSLWQEGKVIRKGTVTGIGKVVPRGRKRFTVPYSFDRLEGGSEYFVKFQLKLKEDKPWGEDGFVQAEEQCAVKPAQTVPAIGESAQGGALKVVQEKEEPWVTVSGDRFTARFDTRTGTLYRLDYDGEKVIADGNGPQLDAFRAFVNNVNWFYAQWFERGLHNLKHKALSTAVTTLKDGNVALSFTVESQAPNGAHISGGTSSGKNSIKENSEVPFGENDFKFTTGQIWTVYPDGSIELQADITSNQPAVILPRLGYIMQIPDRFNRFTYYGRGPVCNYADRKTGQFIEQYESSVEEQMANFPKPQEVGNHEETRWCALTDRNGKGIQFVSGTTFAVQALPYSALDLTLAGYQHQLKKGENNYLRLDCGVTGLGGNSCGQGGPLKPDCVFAAPHRMSFIIRPAAADLTKNAQVRPSGLAPLSITRDLKGDVTISQSGTERELCYSLNGKKTKVYTAPFNLRNGGKVAAWDKKRPEMKTIMNFGKIESIQTQVIYASSQEYSEGNATNLTDNNPGSYWHTMYSVTLAKHPHWIDLDAGEVKSIKGFKYLPRQDGSNNGNVKEYEIRLSQDGKEWGEPVKNGTFDISSKEKSVLFDKPLKARYIRFTALSSHKNADYASGAELIILSDE